MAHHKVVEFSDASQGSIFIHEFSKGKSFTVFVISLFNQMERLQLTESCKHVLHLILLHLMREPSDEQFIRRIFNLGADYTYRRDIQLWNGFCGMHCWKFVIVDWPPYLQIVTSLLIISFD
jgi:hypothetical protein